MSRCPDCGAAYSPKGGGHCMACHRTFTSDASGDFHRVGPYEPRGARVCVDVANDWRVKRDGTRWQVPWRETPRGWTHIPPMTPEQLAARTGTVEATEGPGGTSTPPAGETQPTVVRETAGGHRDR